MLTLHGHPLAAFCHKVLIALYENQTPFVNITVDLSKAEERAALAALWPLGKFPVLVDEDRVVAETSLIIEYLQERHPGPVDLLPADADMRLDVRLWDRIFDLYVSEPMQKIVIDRLRPEGAADPHGVAEARTQLQNTYAMIEARLAGRDWVAGNGFSMADCAAVPALFYATIVEPPEDMPELVAYRERLFSRPSVRRVLEEAKPWFRYFPYRDDMPERFL